MRAVIDHEHATKEVLIWLIQDTIPAGPAVFYPTETIGDLDAKGPSIKLIPDGTLLHAMPASIRPPFDVFEVLVAAGIDFAPPNAAQAAHLADAVQVRDRLLTLVEQGCAAPRFLAAPPEAKP